MAATGVALGGLGVAEPEQARLVDVAVRAALGTGAGVRVVPPEADVPEGLARPALVDRRRRSPAGASMAP